MEPLDYATYFDRNYLTRGLALYRSLVSHSPAFRLWVLCLDQETYHILGRLGLEHVELIPLPTLERADPALLAARTTRSRVEYYWTCGPAFLAYLFTTRPEIGLLSYLDADLFFFADPTPLFDELGDGSILLIPHRWSPYVDRSHLGKGVYQVGLLVFRRLAASLACLSHWRKQCLEWCFDRLEPGRFGDQKYLEDWPSRYEKVVVSRHKGASLGSPSIGNYHYGLERDRVLVDGDPLLFFHFTRFRLVTRWLYDPGIWAHNRGLRLAPLLKRYVYIPYARELRAAGDQVRSVGGPVSSTDSLRWTRNKGLILARMVQHRSFLVVTDRFAL
jgi:hypothetical protein